MCGITTDDGEDVEYQSGEQEKLIAIVLPS